MIHRLTTIAVLTAAITAGACTISNTEPPPWGGPSELALSILVSANPEVISLDGASRSTIRVEARDENGQPEPRVRLRAEIIADGTVTDFGTLSSREIETGNNGIAEFTYTAPVFLAGTIPDLSVSVTPMGVHAGNDASNLLRRFVSIRLVAPGVNGPAPTANFTFAPESPFTFTDVIFDGATSTAGTGDIITSYRWDFGDGTIVTTAEPAITHQFRAVGIYRVSLTVIGSNGLSHTSAPQLVSVSAGSPPTAAFIFSPTAPIAGQPVFFNASTSVPATGRRIVSYRWNWGDGTPNGTGATRSHTFQAAGTYVVVLTVTDDAQQTATVTVQVPVS